MVAKLVNHLLFRKFFVTFAAMEENTLRRILQGLAPWLHREYPGWAVFGSAALRLNGVNDVDVHDIDIVVPTADETLPDGGEGIFRSQRRERMMVEGVEVDISVGLWVRSRGRWRRVTVDEAVEADGLRDASMAECGRLLRLFNRPKDRSRLRLLQKRM
jgi:hypothetical protein